MGTRSGPGIHASDSSAVRFERLERGESVAKVRRMDRGQCSHLSLGLHGVADPDPPLDHMTESNSYDAVRATVCGAASLSCTPA